LWKRPKELGENAERRTRKRVGKAKKRKGRVAANQTKGGREYKRDDRGKRTLEGGLHGRRQMIEVSNTHIGSCGSQMGKFRTLG